MLSLDPAKNTSSQASPISSSKQIWIAFGNILNLLSLGIIWIYQKFGRAYLGNSCRFHPTCSEYGKQAFKTFGFVKASRLTLVRIFRCRPGGSYGMDPLPEYLLEKKNG
ncbi:MAG: membrane protein insertion efficiency factor YidD [Bdellovibrionales bacterium]